MSYYSFILFFVLFGLCFVETISHSSWQSGALISIGGLWRSSTGNWTWACSYHPESTMCIGVSQEGANSNALGSRVSHPTLSVIQHSLKFSTRPSSPFAFLPYTEASNDYLARLSEDTLVCFILQRDARFNSSEERQVDQWSLISRNDLL